MAVSAIASPVTVHVTVCAGELVPATVAVNVWAPPCATLAVSGLTLTPLTVAGALATVMVAVPDLLVSTVEVALTVSVAAVSFAATVSRPAEEMLVPDTPLTLHVTVCAGELVPATVALNCRVAPLITVAVDGLTLTLSTTTSSVSSSSNKKHPPGKKQKTSRKANADWINFFFIYRFIHVLKKFIFNSIISQFKSELKRMKRRFYE
jgi:hypothetical protein